MGFEIAINSMKSLFNCLIDSGTLKHLLTCKFNQDYLELFFCALHACGGFNNIMYSSIQKIITCETNIHENLSITNVALSRKLDLTERFPITDHNYSDCSNIVTLSEYKTVAVQYIAGYVVKKV